MPSPSCRAPLVVLAAGLASVILAGCPRPDPDEALRRHDLDGAAAAWKARTGEDVSFDHRVADVLATRAGRDPSVTAAQVVDALDAARLLDDCPRRGMPSLEVGMESMGAVLGGAEALASGPFLAAIGRSEMRSDRDPYLDGALPFAWGRIYGWARTDAAALGRRVDEDNLPKLLTVSLRDAAGAVCFTAEHRPDGWWTTGASSADAALRVISAGASFARGGAAEVTQVFGAGLTARVP